MRAHLACLILVMQNIYVHVALCSFEHVVDQAVDIIDFIFKVENCV